MTTTIIRVIDFETTGLAPPAGICEIATVDVLVHDDGTIDRDEAWSTLINPGQPIPAEASAVHHIVDNDVTDAPAFDAEIAEHINRGPPFAFCAHNDRFDKQWFNPSGSKWVDTYRIALSLWPDCPRHSNQCLRYWLNLKLADAAVPHRASGDAYVTAAILRRAIVVCLKRGFTLQAILDDFLLISSQPAVLPRFIFGKHAMTPIAQVPGDYLSWILGQKDMEEDVRHTASVELRRRREAQGAAR